MTTATHQPFGIIDYTTVGAPARVTQEKGYVRMYWPVDTTDVPDSFGCTPHYTLTIEHTMHGGIKQYRATESFADASFADGGHKELITARSAVRRVIALQPALRYSAPRFLAFVKGILG